MSIHKHFCLLLSSSSSKANLVVDNSSTVTSESDDSFESVSLCSDENEDIHDDSAFQATATQLTAAGFDPVKFDPELKKTLVFANAMKRQIVETCQKSDKEKAQLVGLLSGAEMHKARMQTQLRKITGCHYRQIHRHGKVPSGKPHIKTRNEVQRMDQAKLVEEFLSRDENSRLNPGKKDFVTVNGEKVQSRLLNDYLDVMYDRFKAEYPDEKISRSTFYALRPKHILTSDSGTTSNCLCKIHENLALCLKAMKPYMQPPFICNPDAFLRQIASADEFRALLASNVYDAVSEDDQVAVRQWKRVLVKDEKYKKNDGMVWKTKCEPSLMSFAALKTEAVTQFTKFVTHSWRIKSQYLAVKELKEKLRPLEEIIVVMDFAENYLTRTADREIQSTYWSPTYVTLHPTCIYYRDAEDELQHQSLIYISNVMHHNSTFVISLIKSLFLTELPKLLPALTLTKVHFLTDSPTSQYRNKYIAYHLSCTPELYGFSATHHYFESGHGKSVCDGIGGAMKRKADQVVNHGNTQISSGQDFFRFAKANQKAIHPVYLTRLEYSTTADDLKVWKDNLASVAGTFALHCLGPGKKGPGHVCHRLVSCMCDNCRADNFSLCSDVNAKWMRQKITKLTKRKRDFAPENMTACPEECRYLCLCSFKNKTDDSSNHGSVNFTDSEEEAEDEGRYVGGGALPGDTIDQTERGNLITFYLMNSYL